MRDLTGKRFGRWQVTGFAGRNSAGKDYWFCVCDCGNTKQVRGDGLTGGRNQSCGCYSRERAKQTGAIRGKLNVKHGLLGTRIYSIWHHMKDRCLNPGHVAYKRYGGRGISICEEWLDPEAFYQWASVSGYRDGLTLDRIDNDAGYCPSNCRWATPKQQANNRCDVKKYAGKTPSEWASQIGISLSAMHRRLKNWPLEVAISTPKQVRHDKRIHS